MRRLCLILVLAVAAAAVLGDEGAIVTTETDAYLVTGGEVIAGPRALDAKWSPSGRYVLVRQFTSPITTAMLDAAAKGTTPAGPPPGQFQLILWDVRSRKATRVWSAPADQGPSVQAEWLAGADVAIATTMVRQSADPQAVARTVARIDARAGTMRSLLETTADGFDSVDPSPFVPRAIVVQTTVGPQGAGVAAQRRAVLVESSGQVRPLREGEPGEANWTVQWSPAGDILVRQASPAAPGGPRAPARWSVLDPSTGRMKPINEPKLSPPVARKSLLAVSRSVEQVKRDGVDATVSLLWLESGSPGEAPRALLCADGDWGHVAPTLDSVVWSARGATWCAPIVKLSLAQFRELRDQARRTALLSNGKQVALSVLMFAQDHDEVLPGPDGLLDKLMPYVKNQSVFAGLVYTFAGGKLGDVKAPAETVLGYIPGPGGKTEIYVDGHVVWKKD